MHIKVRSNEATTPADAITRSRKFSRFEFLWVRTNGQKKAAWGSCPRDWAGARTRSHEHISLSMQKMQIHRGRFFQRDSAFSKSQDENNFFEMFVSEPPFACASCAPYAISLVHSSLSLPGVRRVKVAEKVEVLNDDGDLSLFYPIHWFVQLRAW